MKKSQIYFIDQCQIQYYDYNTAEGTEEFPFQNLPIQFRKSLDFEMWNFLFNVVNMSVSNITHDL